jgi:hypothetical protein
MLLLVVCTAQDQTGSNCPTVSVTGPSGVIPAGEISTYKASIDRKGKVLKLEYVWSVSSGNIVAGQGTSRIEVRESNGSCITATVEIKGFPESCPSTASEFACGDPAPQPTKLDEFVGSLAKVRTERFIEAFNKAKDDSYAQVYIFISGARRNPESSIRKKRQILMKHITITCRYDTQRVTFVDVDNKQDDRVTIWLVPAGANPPNPEAQ